MILKAENVSRQFLRQSRSSNVFYAVKNADFNLEEGKLTEITGRSGSGKSTLLNMLAGLLAPTEGKVFLEGKDLYEMSDEERSRMRNRLIGVIPQGQTGLSALTVLENVMLPCTMYGEEPDEKRAMELLAEMEIEHLKNAYPNELSGGEMRRMAVARALIKNPKVILADEPTGDLDDENTHRVLKLLRKAADEGRAVLLVSHEREAAAYADYIYKMSDGILSL